jgi:protein SCO1
MRLRLAFALVFNALPALAAPAPAPDLSDIAASPPVGARVPADTMFRDAKDHAMPLAELLSGPPVVLALAYYTCPNLCGVTLGGIASALKDTGFRPGADFRLAALSINPDEGPADAAPARSKALDRLGTADGVQFLTGNEPAIRRVAEAVGFRFRWHDGLQQFIHPVGVFVLTPDGRVSRWISGAGFDGTNLRLALTEAGGGRIGDLTDRLRLLCYHYDPVHGIYTNMVLGSLRVAGTLTVLGLAGGIGWTLWRERRRTGS